MTTVAIAEDHLSFCVFSTNFINGLDGFRVVAGVANGLELMEYIQQAGPPDILLLDLKMPHMNGSKTAIWMKANHPDTKILVFSAFESDTVMVSLLKNGGVRGFISKNIHPNDLHTALCGVLKKGTYFYQQGCDKLATLFMDIDAGSASLKKVLLTEREIEFIKRCCSKDTYKEIAEKMNLSPHTITDVINSIQEKTGVEGRGPLSLYAATQGIIYL